MGPTKKKHRFSDQRRSSSRGRLRQLFPTKEAQLGRTKSAGNCGWFPSPLNNPVLVRMENHGRPAWKKFMEALENCMVPEDIRIVGQ